MRVLDNLKDYAVRALVNAVDHLGTVAYKLTDLLEHQTSDVSAMDLKISTLNQRLLTCKIYTDKEGLRQQQLLAFIPRHHKHYILPNHVNKKVHFSPRAKMDARQNQIQTRNRLQSSGTPVAKTLSWHLASETKSTLKKRTSHSSKNMKEPNFSAKTSGVFHLLDNEESTQMKPSAAQTHLPNGVPNYTTATQTMGVMGRDAFEGSKQVTDFRSFDNRNQPEMPQVPSRSKSVLSAFFVKQKMPKLNTGSIS
ncbi:Protein abil1, variant 2 [Stylosanthes scabra]|uniref:Protein abil1, variant 2 n=1 Tax=Stylosanthes scabra TaxID=79078 RepID=A0ABU6U8S2_9FABA|nr:Protein abil1, variant 2 [Stylosanthes scabra]